MKLGGFKNYCLTIIMSAAFLITYNFGPYPLLAKKSIAFESPRAAAEVTVDADDSDAEQGATTQGTTGLVTQEQPTTGANETGATTAVENSNLGTNQNSVDPNDDRQDTDNPAETSVADTVYGNIYQEGPGDTVLEEVYDLPNLEDLLDLPVIPELGEEVVKNIVYNSVSGCVLDNLTGTPLEQVTVTLTGPRGTFTTTTDKAGNYDIMVPKGDYYLVFWLYGYDMEKFIVPLHTDEVQDCVLSRLVPVSFRVTGAKDSNSLKIVRAKLHVGPDFSRPDYELAIGSDGTVDAVMLSPGRYYAKAAKGAGISEFWVTNEGNQVIIKED